MKGSNWTRTSHNGLNNGGRLLQSLHSKYLMEIATSFLRIFFLILLTHRELELNEDNQFLFYIQTLFFSSEPPPKPPPNLLRNLLQCSLADENSVSSDCMGSRSTFEFPYRINLSGPNLYCIARTLG